MFLCLNCNSIKRHNIWRNTHHFRSRQVGWLLGWLVGWLVVLRINVRFSDLSAISRLGSRRKPISKNSNVEAGNRTPGPLAPQAKNLNLTTRPPLLLRSRQAIWSYILIFPEKKWKHSICTTRINRNNLCM